MEPVRLLTFGGCLVVDPLRPLCVAGTRIAYPLCGPVPAIHTFGEMFQAIDILRARRDVPPRVRLLCRMPRKFRAAAAGADFKDVDVVLLEPASPIELIFRGYFINRNGVARQVLDPIAAVSREAKRCAAKWWKTGLIGMNEDVRLEAAEELLTYIPEGMENADLARAVIRETRTEKSDIAGGFRRMQDLIGKPMGIVIYIFQYLADGRAISWPAGFHEEIIATARQLGLPIFEPAEVVRRHGVAAALDADLRHYNDAFMPKIADDLASFVESVFAASRSPLGGQAPDWLNARLSGRAPKAVAAASVFSAPGRQGTG